MNKKMISTLLISSLLVLMTACSSDSSMKEDRVDFASGSDSGYEVGESAPEHSEAEGVADEDSNDKISKEISNEISTNRMIIHEAKLEVNVKSLDKAQLNIEKKVNEYGGYIVASNVYRENEERVSGNITVRVPEKHYQKFLLDAEEEAADILKRTVTGQDVTEQYVDLESRVKSKRAVEERLLEFMSNAKKTEDLLKISSDLAKIQEEIELIVGKMNYLENQTSYSTIEIAMYENSIIVPTLDSKKLDTWEKTKKQLATSTNFLLAAGSGVIVFVIGNIPVIVLLLLVGTAIYIVLKRKLVNLKSDILCFFYE